jgi:hypothetical protein
LNVQKLFRLTAWPQLTLVAGAVAVMHAAGASRRKKGFKDLFRFTVLPQLTLTAGAVAVGHAAAASRRREVSNVNDMFRFTVRRRSSLW